MQSREIENLSLINKNFHSFHCLCLLICSTEMKKKEMIKEMVEMKTIQNNKTYRFVPEDLYSVDKPNRDANTSSNVAEPRDDRSF